MLYDKNFDIHNVVVLEEPIRGYEIKADEDVVVKNISYTPNKITLTTKSKNDQLLFISDNYFPGWSAKVDGVDTPIYRADYTFRAIPIKKGEHNVLMYYFPNSFKWGIWISVGTFICLIVIFLFVTITKIPEKLRK